MKVFSRSNCELGEGILWHPGRKSIFWVDISQRQLFEKSIDSTAASHDRTWALDFIGTALFIHKDKDQLWIVTDIGLVLFNLITNTYRLRIPYDLGSGMRSNDAGIAPDGSLWFGSMEMKPTGLKGALYRIDNYGKVDCTREHIGIPNTFCWAPCGSLFYLSDSWQQKMFRFDYSPTGIDKPVELLNLTATPATPDGGALDSGGGLWNAQWDGHGVFRYSAEGALVGNIALPVPRPTSCCFGGEEMTTLFVTSAKEGLMPDELARHPDSGSVFALETGVKGMSTQTFELLTDDDVC